MNNAHVIKWYRWRAFLAQLECRQLAQLYWVTQEMIELKSNNI